MESKILQSLSYKHAIIDTNVLVNWANHKKEFDSKLFSLLNEYNIKPAIDEIIKYEFLSNANNPNNLQARNDFLDIILGTDTRILPICSENFQDARYISNICFSMGHQIKIIDSLIASQLKKYQDEVILITCDHSDFTLKIFDRIRVITIDVGSNIFNVGFYKFNRDKYTKAVKLFAKSKNSNQKIK